MFRRYRHAEFTLSDVFERVYASVSKKRVGCVPANPELEPRAGRVERRVPSLLDELNGRWLVLGNERLESTNALVRAVQVRRLAIRWCETHTL